MKYSHLFNMMFVIILCLGCSNDDDNNEEVENTGNMVFKNMEIKLSQAYLKNYGQKGNSYNFDFIATGGGIDANQAAVIYFELFSSIPEDLAVGSYSLGNYEDATPNTFTKWGEIIIASHIDSNPSKTDYVIKDGVRIRPSSGTFTVHSTGEIHEIEFSGLGIVTSYIDGEVNENIEADVPFSVSYKGNIAHHIAQENQTKASITKKRHNDFTLLNKK